MNDGAKLTSGELQAMLDAIWKHHEVLASLKGRRDCRYGVRRGVYAVITFKGALGGDESITPVMRDVSRSGMSVLHGGELDVGLVVVCVFVDGSAEPLARVGARVVRSRHVRGVVHELGFEFDRSIEIENIALTGEDRPQLTHPSVAPEFAAAVRALDRLVRTGAEVDVVRRAVESVRAMMAQSVEGGSLPRSAVQALEAHGGVATGADRHAA